MEFKPFDKVMVRNSELSPWKLAYYDHYEKNFGHFTDQGTFSYCELFNENRYLSQFNSSYEELQQKWLQDHDVKLRSIVKVIKNVDNFENGWNGVWHGWMDRTLNLIGEVIIIDVKRGMRVRFFNVKYDDYNYPYFALEVIKP